MELVITSPRRFSTRNIMKNVMSGVLVSCSISCCLANHPSTVQMIMRLQKMWKLDSFKWKIKYGNQSVMMQRLWLRKCLRLIQRKDAMLVRHSNTNGLKMPQTWLSTRSWWRSLFRTCCPSTLSRKCSRPQWVWWYRIWLPKMKSVDFNRCSKH
jgi:hypothetical protein